MTGLDAVRARHECLGMGRLEAIHRLIRACCALYPFRRTRAAAWINRRLDLLFESRRPNWLLAPGKGDWPTMELNVSTNLQRKFYYFPRVYGRFYGGTWFREVVATVLAPGDGFLDIGANVGFFSLLAAKQVGPTGRVYAFEPEPDICEALSRSAIANGYAHLRTFNLALSDREGELTFHRARDGTASSLVREAEDPDGRYERTLTTQVTRLDTLVRDGKLDPSGVRLIKVDVEGEEARAVAGMLGALEAAGWPAIWCEVRGPGSRRAPNTYAPVRDLLAPLGYRPFSWGAGGRGPVDEAAIVRNADVLFERT